MADDVDGAAAWGDLFAKASDIPSVYNDSGSGAFSQRKQEEDEIDHHHKQRIINSSSSNKHRRSSKKRKRKDNDEMKHQKQQQNEHYQEMIESRIAPVVTNLEKSKEEEEESKSTTFLSNNWPSWIKVGRHLYYAEDKCNKFIPIEEEEEVKNGSDPVRCRQSKCQNCGQSALYHCIEVNPNEEVSSYSSSSKSSLCLDMFTAIRNIRCCGKIIILSQIIPQKTRNHPHKQRQKYNGDDNNTIPYAKELYQTIEYEYNRLLLLFQKLSFPDEEEAKLLESKIKQIAKYPNLFQKTKEKFAAGNNSREGKKKIYYHTNNGIRLVMDCDAIYYRLYYLQLIGLIQQQSRRHNIIPHPDQYFGGWNYLTQDLSTGRDALLDLITNKRVVDDDESKSKNEIINILSCGSGMNWILHGTRSHNIGNDSDEEEEDNETGRKRSSSSNKNPLAHIWRYRMLETCSIFDSTGWTNEPGTVKSMLSSLKGLSYHPVKLNDEFESLHETPAPSPLGEWRDSCRDFICNLYAYATMSPSTLEELTTILRKKNLQAIEVGAGTGYIAKLLIDSGIDVEAWDIHPTTNSSATTLSTSSALSINEYHGATPSFCEVKKSSSSSSSSLFSQTSSSNKALLLCYPPPQNPMAVETLQAYLDVGGKYLIHIGEFKGLTGNSNFEDLLLSRMQCKYRSPCLSWGTDASHVTIWKTIQSDKDKKKKKRSVLLPCSVCGINEAQKRCRLMRSLVYCSKDCSDSHSKIRRSLLRLNMIAIDKDIEKSCLNFKRTDHFQQL